MSKKILTDQEAVVNNEPPKRQRRWNNSSSVRNSEPHGSLAPATIQKEPFQSTAPKRNFSRSDSKVSEDSPKERVGE